MSPAFVSAFPLTVTLLGGEQSARTIHFFVWLLLFLFLIIHIAIAKWTGVPLSQILDLVGTSPHARDVVYRSFEPDWWESIGMADALHPQSLVTYSMNGGKLPVPFGGPLRLRVPRQLGYKSLK